MGEENSPLSENTEKYPGEDLPRNVPCHNAPDARMDSRMLLGVPMGTQPVVDEDLECWCLVVDCLSEATAGSHHSHSEKLKALRREIIGFLRTKL